MQKIYFTILLCLTLTLAVSAQKIVKPTLTPTEATATQKQIIVAGIKLHDEKKFDEAIKLYEQVLRENPNNDLALYELMLSYYNQKNYAKANETAYKLVQYKSNLGVLGYGTIASILDDQGKPQEAVEIFQKAIKKLNDEPGFASHVASLHYNLGITYFRQKKYKEARETLKKSVELDFSMPSPNFVLSEIYLGTKYKVPALLAAARTLSLETDSTRAKRAATIFLGVLAPAEKDEKTGDINIFLDLNAPKDEGDFGMFDLLLGTLTTVKTDEDKGRSDNEIFADAVDTVIALAAEDKKLRTTFVGKTYIPFMTEMKKQNFSQTFAYLVLQQNGNKDAADWLVKNAAQRTAFVEWAKNYRVK